MNFLVDSETGDWRTLGATTLRHLCAKPRRDEASRLAGLADLRLLAEGSGHQAGHLPEDDRYALRTGEAATPGDRGHGQIGGGQKLLDLLTRDADKDGKPDFPSRTTKGAADAVRETP